MRHRLLCDDVELLQSLIRQEIADLNGRPFSVLHTILQVYLKMFTIAVLELSEPATRRTK